MIGKIGSNGHPFYVGKNRTLKSNVSGGLYFGYNDNPANFGDNEIGQHIATLLDDIVEPGHYSVSWNGRFSSGSVVSSDVHFYRLTSDNQVLTKKMIL